MDPRDFLRLLIERLGTNPTRLAREMQARGRTDSNVQPNLSKWLRNPAHDLDPKRTAAPLAAHLGFDMQALYSGAVAEAEAQRLGLCSAPQDSDGSVTTDLTVRYDIQGNGQPETARPYPSGNRIPVVGSALLGDNGHFVELEYPVGHGDGWVDIASRDPNAYALRCRGDSMKPRIQSGEFVVVEPNTEPTPGDEVLVKAVDGRVMVKKYLYRRDGRVHLISVNEAHPSIAIEENNIAAMHYVGAIVKVSRWTTT